MAILFAKMGDPDQTPCSAASDLDLHCLPLALLGSPHYNGLGDGKSLSCSLKTDNLPMSITGMRRGIHDILLILYSSR